MLGGVSGAQLNLGANPDWAWFGWNGVVDLNVSVTHKLSVDGKFAVLVKDFEAFGAAVIGKQYTAVGFDNVPGTVVNCTISVNMSTVATRLKVGDDMACGAETSGTFVINVVPSMMAGAPPVPDPVQIHSGTWTFQDAGQQKLRTR